MTWGLASGVVTFGSHRALDDVSLDVSAGHIAVVVGGDGAGKSTLARVLVGLKELDSGEVTRPPITGFQPETSGVWRDMTVLENLQFVAGAYGLDASHADHRISELLEVTSLAEAIHRLGRQLSGGMRQKLGVAMAVLSEPDLLVLDEPTTGLDPVSRVELWDFINRSAVEGRGVVVTTTYVEEAARGTTVLALDEGKVLASGTVEDVVESMPGRVFSADQAVGRSWRRGSTWRVWSEDGTPVPGARRVAPDLADVMTVAALRREAAE